MTVMPTPRAAESAPFSVTAAETRSTAAPVSVMRVTGEADPNILARIVQPMVKLDLMPRYFQVLSEESGQMLAEIAFAGVDAQRVKRLQSTLQAVIGVTAVELR
jgi:hypothetical protein